MKIVVFDLECPGFNPDYIHCLSAAVYSQGAWRLKSTTDYDDMRRVLATADVLIAHNSARFDLPILERILGVEFKGKLIDSLFISWYLRPNRLRHGLADYGEDFGIPKPVVEDWENLPIETYIHRCEEDTRINYTLWDEQWKDLMTLYDNDEEQVWKLIDYLMFKASCAREAEKSRWKLDVERCMDSLTMLEDLKEEKVQQLKEAMPKILKYKIVERPVTLYKSPSIKKKPTTYRKANGDLSAAGIKFNQFCVAQGLNPDDSDSVEVPSTELTAKAIIWLDLLEQYGLPETHKEPIEILVSTEDANPSSNDQVKTWLYSLGWVPVTFKTSISKTTGIKKDVEQLRIDSNGEKLLCPSVKKLIEIEPSIEALDGITVISHRIGILKGYLENVDDEGYIKAQIGGLANTLRFKHRTIVNLPAVSKPYGDIVRGVLIAPEGMELCGSDMAALENRIRDHYIYPLDPDFVETMADPTYDGHLAIAVTAGFITEAEMEFYKWYKKQP